MEKILVQVEYDMATVEFGLLTSESVTRTISLYDLEKVFIICFADQCLARLK